MLNVFRLRKTTTPSAPMPTCDAALPAPPLPFGTLNADIWLRVQEHADDRTFVTILAVNRALRALPRQKALLARFEQVAGKRWPAGQQIPTRDAWCRDIERRFRATLALTHHLNQSPSRLQWATLPTPSRRRERDRRKQEDNSRRAGYGPLQPQPAAVFSHGGRFIVTHAAVYDVLRRRPDPVLHLHRYETVRISPDERWMLAYRYWGKRKLWDTRGAVPQLRHLVREPGVFSTAAAAFTQDSQRLVVSSYPNVLVFSMRNPEAAPPRVPLREGYVPQRIIADCSPHFFIGHTVRGDRLWSLDSLDGVAHEPQPQANTSTESPMPLFGDLQQTRPGFCVTRHGRPWRGHLPTLPRGIERHNLWDLRSSSPVRHGFAHPIVDFSADGRFVVTHPQPTCKAELHWDLFNAMPPPPQSNAQLWDLRGSGRAFDIPDTARINNASFSPDGKHCVVRSDYGMRVMDLRTWPPKSSALVFSTGGAWHEPSYGPRTMLPWQEFFQSGGCFYLRCSQDLVVAFELGTKQPAAWMQKSERRFMRDMSVSHNGRFVAIVDSESGQNLRLFTLQQALDGIPERNWIFPFAVHAYRP